MSIAFLYAGQGSQVLGMGKDLEEKEPVFAQVLGKLDPNHCYRDMMYGEDVALLSQTQNTQPCMVTFAMATTALLESKGITPHVVAGLSLGEYSALACAKVFSPETAVELVAFRGKVMDEAVTDVPSTMKVILGMESDLLQEICDQCASLGVVEIANYNCPGQLVITGETEAVEEVGKRAKEQGAKRVLPMNVSGPFHSSLMAEAGKQLEEKFKSVTFATPEIPVVTNVTGRPLEKDVDISENLVKQVQSSVYFQTSIQWMLENGVDTFVEIGPGAVLSGFLKKIMKEWTAAPEQKDGIKVYSISDVASLEQCLQGLK